MILSEVSELSYVWVSEVMFQWFTRNNTGLNTSQKVLALQPPVLAGHLFLGLNSLLVGKKKKRLVLMISNLIFNSKIL